MKKTYLIFLTFILSGLFISCDESFLDKSPVGSIPTVYLLTPDATESLLIGAYSHLNAGGIGMWTQCVFNEIQGSVRGGEFVKGSSAFDFNPVSDAMSFQVLPTSSMSSDPFRNGFTGVDRCNTVLRMVDSTAITGWATGQQDRIRAEARFLRSVFYMHLKKNFYNIPWIGENTMDKRVKNYEGDPDDENYVDIWPNIFADFEYAMNNLPDQQSQPARVNSWAAQCFLAEAYIYAGTYDPVGYGDMLDDAYDLLDDAIDNGQTSRGLSYELLANYHDNFDAALENVNSEYIFGIELSTLDGDADGMMASPNSMQSAQFTAQIREGGWGFQQPSEWFANHFRTKPTSGLPYLDMFGETGPDFSSDTIDDDYGVPFFMSPYPFTPDTQGFDPRMDWVIGRYGIEYLGQGNMGSSGTPYSWVRVQADAGPYVNKKWKSWADQKGVFESNNNCYPSINLPLMRLADAILLKAEMEVRVNDDLEAARVLVNDIRQRMVNNSTSPRNWVMKEGKLGTTPAANYRIGLYEASPAYPFDTPENALKAILYERTLELGHEGKRFYDVVRFGLGDGVGGFEAEDEFDTYLDFQKSLKSPSGGPRYSFWTASYDFIPGRDEFSAIPTSAIDNSIKDGEHTLIQNPNY